MTKFLEKDWEFSVLNIYNYNKKGPFSIYFDFIKKNHKKLPGDLLEAGVYQGKSLLSVALFLKEIGSTKKIFGYDTWAGFPQKEKKNYNDDFERWKQLLIEKKIAKSHYNEILKNREFISFIKKKIEKKLIHSTFLLQVIFQIAQLHS